jgi:paraquat-inducible protein B
MSDQNQEQLSSFPRALIKRSKDKFSPIWLLPIITLLIGAFLIGQAVLARGAYITITFKTAEGLAIGTKIKYRNVDIGSVGKITLSDDQKLVNVEAKISRQAKSMLVADTKFWVVRPRISGGNITGLGTVLAGSHIGLDVGKSKDSARKFTGLESPPIITSDVPGSQYVLISDDAGSLDIGSPVYYRHLQAGQVVGFQLAPDGKQVQLTVFVNEPYNQYVNKKTRFWHARGIDVKVDSSGIKVDTESLVSILFGGIAFENIAGAVPLPPAPTNSVFTTFKNQDDAFKVPDTTITKAIMVFNESVRGLSVGAQIDFQGIIIGEVVENTIDFDTTTKQTNVVVLVNLYPDRLSSKFRKNSRLSNTDANELLTLLVSRGLRAQIRASNLLTGQLYIALDFFPKAQKVNFDANATPIKIPTVPGSLRELQTTLASIANKLDQLPVDAIAQDLQKTLFNVNKLIVQIDEKLAPEAGNAIVEMRETLLEAKHAMTEAQHTLKSIEQSVGKDGKIQQDAHEAMREITRAAQSTRALVDYLERHPEALIRGKAEDEKQ